MQPWDVDPEDFDDNSCPLHLTLHGEPEEDDVRALKPCSLWRPRNSPRQMDTSGIGLDDEHV
jgi:hypothetical protein